MQQKLNEAVGFIKSKMGDFSPEVAIVLGSGLGDFADKVQKVCEIKFADIPNFPTTSVLGHAGKLVLGLLNGKKVAIMQGRVHYYEGYQMSQAVFPIYVLAGLGVKTLVLTNAVGAINANYNVGDFIATRDHINMTGYNPLIGHDYDFVGLRFVSMTNAYSQRINKLLMDIGAQNGIKVWSGVFMQVSGPSFETPAEINMYKMCGADTIGMSSAIETIAGRHNGLEVAMLSSVSNLASGVDNYSPNHKEVLENGLESKDNFAFLLGELLKKM